MTHALLTLALAVLPAAAELSAVPAADALGAAKGGEPGTKVLNGDLVSQVCALRGAFDGACVYECRDGLPLRTRRPAGECPRTVLRDLVESSEKGRFGRGPWDRPGDRRPGGRASLECSAGDRGWEEHWGGHVSRGWDLGRSAAEACRLCKQPTGPHGECTVTCSEPMQACRWEFVPDQGPAQEGGWGRPEQDSWRAEEEALDRCRRENWGRQGRCRVSRCERQDRTLLRERCR